MITLESLRRKNFNPEDFLVSDTAKALNLDNNPNLNQLTAGICLANKMQELRDKVGLPIIINSAFRSEKVNDAVKGSKNSWHLQFLACDFLFKGKTPEETLNLVEQSKVSIDKALVERNCVHVQTCMNDKDNRNLFGKAVYNEKAKKWDVAFLKDSVNQTITS